MTAPTTLPPDADTGAGGRALSPAPGPHIQRMRRLIAAFVAITAAVTGIFIAITIRVSCCRPSSPAPPPRSGS